MWLSVSGTLGSLLEMLHVLGDLPVRNPGAMALDLEPLDRQEGLDDLWPESRAEHVIALERVERLLERARKRVAGRLDINPVGVAGYRRRRRELPTDSVGAGS